jgi:hypothetical protein
VARYTWAIRWAKNHRVIDLERKEARWRQAWGRDPEKLTSADRAQFAAARHVLGLPPLPGLPDVTQ